MVLLLFFFLPFTFLIVFSHHLECCRPNTEEVTIILSTVCQSCLDCV